VLRLFTDDRLAVGRGGVHGAHLQGGGAGALPGGLQELKVRRPGRGTTGLGVGGGVVEGPAVYGCVAGRSENGPSIRSEREHAGVPSLAFHFRDGWGVMVGAGWG
jgi:hypothetical protein